MIRELFYGNINPLERKIKPDSECYKIGKQIVEYEDKLSESMSENQTALFEKFKSLVGEEHCISECNSFVTGFRLGASLMAEVFYGKE